MPGVEVHHEGSVIVVTVEGMLDNRSGPELLRVVGNALVDETDRVDVDLRALTSFTPDGAAALAGCRALCVGVREGLHYRTGKGPGQEALLAAYPVAP